MRNFFDSHWKTVLAILLAIVLAVLTFETQLSEAPLARRLQAHTRALVLDAPATGGALQYIQASLRRYGYVPDSRHGGNTAHGGHSVEVALSRLAPGERPGRIFIVGAHLAQDVGAGAAGAAAVLELARAAKALRPAYGTEIRFVFFIDDDKPAGAGLQANGGGRDGGNFMAFVGTRASSNQMRQALAALRSDPMLARQGLAAPAHVMGLTLSGHGSRPDDGPALVITEIGLLNFPYLRTQAPAGQDQDRNDYDSMARIVDGLARTLGALASAVDV